MLKLGALFHKNPGQSNIPEWLQAETKWPRLQREATFVSLAQDQIDAQLGDPVVVRVGRAC